MFKFILVGQLVVVKQSAVHTYLSQLQLIPGPISAQSHMRAGREEDQPEGHLSFQSPGHNLRLWPGFFIRVGP